MVLAVAEVVLVRLNVAVRLEVDVGDIEEVGNLVGDGVFEVRMEPLADIGTVEDIVTVPVLLNVALFVELAILDEVVVRLFVEVGLDEAVDEIEAEGYSVEDTVFEALLALKPLGVMVTIEEVVGVLL